MKKDVIYIDADDDITTIIDKVKAAKSKIVALVPPKRSAVLQSAVNLKLLKRASETADKRLVLITNEAALLPLAGGIGLHVAKDLQSRPAVPVAPAGPPMGSNRLDAEPALDPSTPVGKLAGLPDEPEELPPEEPAKPIATKGKPKGAQDKISVPNFERFRLKLILLGVGVIGLIVAWIVGFKILPTGAVNITARASNLDVKVKLTADTKLKTDDIAAGKLAGKEVRLTKSLSENFTATGEKNVGKKASGTINVINNCYNPGKLPAGTTFKSGSLSFVSTAAVTVPDAVPSAGSCSSPTSAAVAVRATQAGDNYNLAEGTSYAINSYSKSDLSGSGEQLAGGTTEIAKVVSAEDVKKATNALITQSFDDIKDELRDKLGSDMYLIADSLRQAHHAVKAEPKVGAKADQGSVTTDFIFTAIGVNRASITEVLEAAEKAKLSGDNQALLDNGLDDATTEVGTRTATAISFSLGARGFAGPDINTDDLAKEIAGKRFSEAQSIILSKAGVKAVKIDLSPFWVTHAPRASRITISVNVDDAATE